MDIVTIRSLKKYFHEGDNLIKALDGIDLSIEKGAFAAVIGASGSGKTTLLHTIGGLCEPTSGTVEVAGTDLWRLEEEQLTVFRRRKIGFIFQDYNLIPELTVKENILFPLALDHSRVDEAFFAEIAGLLGIAKRLADYPRTLSGGMQQRAAIARALITKPAIVLADEPTGSCDTKTSQNIAGLLKLSAETFHQTLILITHNPELAQLADRTIRLKNGRIFS